MHFCFGVIFVLLFGLTSSQDEPDTEPVESIMELMQEATDVICNTCACADGVVDCHKRDIRAPFTLGDWQGLQNFTPTAVDLSGNPLDSLTRISALPIRTLNLSYSDIETMESGCFKNLIDLVTLDLSHNKISTASLNRRIFEGQIAPGAELLPFPKMKALNLSHNDIHALPQDLFMFMVELTHLDLSGNPLAYIDQVTMAAITELIRLRNLRLSSCELETLPEGLFRRQRRLEYLDLSDNSFTTVPSVLNEAVNLVYLNLDRNAIAAMNEKTAISKLTKLKELRLCRLSKLQTIGAGVLGGLESLTTLHICYNPRLTTLNPDFLMWEDSHEVERYPLLKQLYLNNNNLSEINAHLLERWDTLTDVDFTSNPYVCDCNNKWMVDVLVPLIRSTVANDTVTSMYCKKPPNLRGLSFAKLRDQSVNLTCPEVNEINTLPGPDMAIILGIMIGIFATFPLVLVVVLMWRRGYFAKCRGKTERKDYEEETDAF